MAPADDYDIARLERKIDQLSQQLDASYRILKRRAFFIMLMVFISWGIAAGPH